MSEERSRILEEFKETEARLASFTVAMDKAREAAVALFEAFEKFCDQDAPSE